MYKEKQIKYYLEKNIKNRKVRKCYSLRNKLKNQNTKFKNNIVILNMMKDHIKKDHIQDN